MENAAIIIPFLILMGIAISWATNRHKHNEVELFLIENHELWDIAKHSTIHDWYDCKYTLALIEKARIQLNIDASIDGYSILKFLKETKE